MADIRFQSVEDGELADMWLHTGPDQQRAHADGCNVFLLKPSPPEQLVREIRGSEPTALKR
jgi:hypothetical protein